MTRSTRWALGALVAATLLVPAPALATFPGENGNLAYVSGKGGPAGNDSGADLYIKGPQQSDGVLLDDRQGQHRHPSWSPDLKFVAYALFDTPSNEKVWVQPVAGGTPQRLGPNESSVRDDRPSWSPDGTRIAYESEATDGSNQMDILVTDISDFITGPTVNLTKTPGFTEGKPVWSPDGKWIYFSRHAGAPNVSGDDDILRVRSDGSSAFPEFVINSAIAEYQPALSPDGKRMCYTRGPFGSADADVYVHIFNSSVPDFDLSDTTTGGYNCAWSPDGKLVAYVVGVFSAGALVVEPITDTGSTLLVPDTTSHFDGNPDWAPLHPARCEGLRATITGTDARDVIKGTGGRDVIASFGGNDTVSSLGGNDLVCGGKGADTLKGGDGKDRLDGGKGTDTCDGGPGLDTKKSCEH